MQGKKATYFRSNPLLVDVAMHDLDRLTTHSEVIRVPRKSAVWTPASKPKRVYWMRSGVVKVVGQLHGKREITLRFHMKGDVFGEASLFERGARATRAEAQADAVVIATPAAEVRALARRNGAFALRLAAILSGRASRLEARLGGVTILSAPARLAALFLELAEDFGVRDSRGVIVNLRLTHKEMASLIGVTRETVSFCVLDMRKKGLIQTEGKRVVLLNVKQLAKMVTS
jgi:CRP-like cAMP-binding protein